VGRPDNGLQRIRAAFRSVVRERRAHRLGRSTAATAARNRASRRRSHFARDAGRTHVEVVVVDVRFPTTVGGPTFLGRVAGLTALLLLWLLLLRERVLSVPRPFERHDVARRIVGDICGRGIDRRPATSSAATSSAGAESWSGARAGVGREYALPARGARHEVERRFVVAEIERGERKLRRRVRTANRRAERCGELAMVER